MELGNVFDLKKENNSLKQDKVRLSKIMKMINNGELNGSQKLVDEMQDIWNQLDKKVKDNNSKMGITSRKKKRVI